MYLKQEVAKEIANWRTENSAAIRQSVAPRRPSWNRYGMQKLVGTAIKYFELYTGVNLPWNLASWGPYRGYSLHPKKREYENKEVFNQAARFGGWIMAAAHIPGLVTFIAKTTSQRGVNSPHTYLDLWRAAERFPSPHRFYRRLCAVRRRANQILHPYGVNVSNHALAIALQFGPNRTGKAARKAAADTLRYLLWHSLRLEGQYTDIEILMGFRGFCQIGIVNLEHIPIPLLTWAIQKCAKNIFQNLNSAIHAAENSLQAENIAANSRENIDYSNLWIDKYETVFIHGIRVDTAISGGGFWYYIVTHNGRRFVTPQRDTPRCAVQDAIIAWKEERDNERRTAEAINFFRNNNNFIYREDALNARFCDFGVRDFLRRHGLNMELDKVSSSWLLSVLDDSSTNKEEKAQIKIVLVRAKGDLT